MKHYEAFVCTVHAFGDGLRSPEETARLIARLLNDEEIRAYAEGETR